VRALRCGCGRRLEGGDDAELFGRVPDHPRGAHPVVAFGEEQVLAFVTHAFRYERATAHEGARVPADEGLGTEPRLTAARVHPGRPQRWGRDASGEPEEPVPKGSRRACGRGPGAGGASIR
jgi:hypothetical protein